MPTIISYIFQLSNFNFGSFYCCRNVCKFVLEMALLAYRNGTIFFVKNIMHKAHGGGQCKKRKERKCAIHVVHLAKHQ